MPKRKPKATTPGRLSGAEAILRQRIVHALSYDGFLSEPAASEAAFHLTDWIPDLHELLALYNSKTWKSDDAVRVLLAFVVHAPAHLAAAHRILMGLPVTDAFMLGAVKGTGRARRKPGAAYQPQGAAKSKRSKSPAT